MEQISFLTLVLVEVVRIQLVSYETWYLITIICITLLLPLDLLFTAYRSNTAKWLLGSSKIKQTITLRYGVPEQVKIKHENQS